MGYGLRYPDLPSRSIVSRFCPLVGTVASGASRVFLAPPTRAQGHPSALQPVLATEGSARTAPHPPGYTSPGGALGSTQGGFSVLFSQHWKPIGPLAETVA